MFTNFKHEFFQNPWTDFLKISQIFFSLLKYIKGLKKVNCRDKNKKLINVSCQGGENNGRKIN